MTRVSITDVMCKWSMFHQWKNEHRTRPAMNQEEEEEEETERDSSLIVHVSTFGKMNRHVYDQLDRIGSEWETIDEKKRKEKKTSETCSMRDV
jgi:hypothetical protein